MFSILNSSFIKHQIKEIVTVSNDPIPQNVSTGVSGASQVFYLANGQSNQYIGPPSTFTRSDHYPVSVKSGTHKITYDLSDNFLIGRTIYFVSKCDLGDDKDDEPCYFLLTSTSSNSRVLSCIMATKEHPNNNDIFISIASQNVNYLQENCDNATNNSKNDYLHSFLTIYQHSNGQRRFNMRIYNEDKTLCHNREFNVPNDFSTDMDLKLGNGCNFLLTGTNGRRVTQKNTLIWDKVLRHTDMLQVVHQNS